MDLERCLPRCFLDKKLLLPKAAPIYARTFLGLPMAPTVASLGKDTGSRGTSEAGKVQSDGNGSGEAFLSIGIFLVSFSCVWDLLLTDPIY